MTPDHSLTKSDKNIVKREPNGLECGEQEFLPSPVKTPRFFDDDRVHSEFKVWFYDPEKQPRIQQNLIGGAQQYFLEPFTFYEKWSVLRILCNLIFQKGVYIEV